MCDQQCIYFIYIIELLGNAVPVTCSIHAKK
jgi:hypothetical protein